jgi:hypothetical protein
MAERTHKEQKVEDKTRSTLVRAARKFLIALGSHKCDAYAFATLAEIAKKDFFVELVGADPTDLSFIAIARDERVIENLLSKRGLKKSKQKKKYEQIPFSDLEARTP